MNDTIRFLLSLSIVPAVLIGIVRFNKIDKSYYPFIYNITTVLVVEVISRVLTLAGSPDAFLFTLNLYSIVDFCLSLWLFHNWGLFGRNRKFALTLAGIFVVIWLVTNTIFTRFIVLNFYFFILYSFALIFFSVNTFNKAVIHERVSIFRNAKFWICLGMVIFYSFFIVFSSSHVSLFIRSASREFRAQLQSISTYSNLLVNFLYAVAVLWIPRKKNFTSLF